MRNMPLPSRCYSKVANNSANMQAIALRRDEDEASQLYTCQQWKDITRRYFVVPSISGEEQARILTQMN